MFRDQEGFADLRKAVTAYEDKRTEMLEAVAEAAERKDLAADKVIIELFDLAEFVVLTEDIWDKAKRRYDLRNPPGKGKSYGDAVHWVSLLEGVPNGCDLSIVSTDRDFSSDLDGDRISDFLREEWREQKESDVTLYASLPDMVRDHYPDMKLLQALEKEMAERALAVNALVASTKFAETHDGVAVVASYSDFLPAEVERLLDAAITNTQIRWILEDDDVFAFYSRLVHQYQDVIDPGLLAEFWGQIEEDSWDEDES